MSLSDLAAVRLADANWHDEKVTAARAMLRELLARSEAGDNEADAMLLTLLDAASTIQNVRAIGRALSECEPGSHVAELAR